MGLLKIIMSVLSIHPVLFCIKVYYLVYSIKKSYFVIEYRSILDTESFNSLRIEIKISIMIFINSLLKNVFF